MISSIFNADDKIAPDLSSKTTTNNNITTGVTSANGTNLIDVDAYSSTKINILILKVYRNSDVNVCSMEYKMF